MFDNGRWHTTLCQPMTWHICIRVQGYLGYLHTKGHLWYLPMEGHFWYLSIKLENFQNWEEMLVGGVGFGFVWVEGTHLQSDIVRTLHIDGGRDWKVWEGGSYTVLGFSVVEGRRVLDGESVIVRTHHTNRRRDWKGLGRPCWLHWRSRLVGDGTEAGIQSFLLCFAICCWRFFTGILLSGVYWRGLVIEISCAMNVISFLVEGVVLGLGLGLCNRFRVLIIFWLIE